MIKKKTQALIGPLHLASTISLKSAGQEIKEQNQSACRGVFIFFTLFSSAF